MSDVRLKRSSKHDTGQQGNMVLIAGLLVVTLGLSAIGVARMITAHRTIASYQRLTNHGGILAEQAALALINVVLYNWSVNPGQIAADVAAAAPGTDHFSQAYISGSPANGIPAATYFLPLGGQAVTLTGGMAYNGVTPPLSLGLTSTVVPATSTYSIAAVGSTYKVISTATVATVKTGGAALISPNTIQRTVTATIYQPGPPLGARWMIQYVSYAP